MEEAAFRPTYPWLRRVEGAPRLARTVWCGPPDFDVPADRAGCLRALRAVLTDNGFAPARLRSTFQHRVVARDAEVLERLEADEWRANSGEHWWNDHIVWCCEEGKIVSIADPDGWDLLLYGWPAAAEGALDALEMTINRLCRESPRT